VFGYTAVSLPQLMTAGSRISIDRNQASWIGEFRLDQCLTAALMVLIFIDIERTFPHPPPISIFQLFPTPIFSAPFLPILATILRIPAQTPPPQKIKKLWVGRGKRFELALEIVEKSK